MDSLKRTHSRRNISPDGFLGILRTMCSGDIVTVEVETTDLIRRRDGSSLHLRPFELPTLLLRMEDAINRRGLVYDRPKVKLSIDPISSEETRVRGMTYDHFFTPIPEELVRIHKVGVHTDPFTGQVLQATVNQQAELNNMQTDVKTPISKRLRPITDPEKFKAEFDKKQDRTQESFDNYQKLTIPKDQNGNYIKPGPLPEVKIKFNEPNIDNRFNRDGDLLGAQGVADTIRAMCEGLPHKEWWSFMRIRLASWKNYGEANINDIKDLWPEEARQMREEALGNRAFYENVEKMNALQFVSLMVCLGAKEFSKGLRRLKEIDLDEDLAETLR